MIEQILDCWKKSTYDFRLTANPDDPLRRQFDNWVDYYRLKRAIASVLEPTSILEIGVRYGYSAMAFLDGSPKASYLGIDLDVNTFGGTKGALAWARQITRGFSAEFIVADTQQMAQLPGGSYDLIHVDGQQDGDGTFHDLKLALAQARYILLDGYFWSRDNLLAATSFLDKFRDMIDYTVLVPGYAGELLIRVRQSPEAAIRKQPASSKPLSGLYDSQYYLCDCGGYETYNQTGGKSLEDPRLRSVAVLAEVAGRPERVLDLGCGRGELLYHFATKGLFAVGVDYSTTAIQLAERCFEGESALRSRVDLVCGDVCSVPLSGSFNAVLAADLIEHLGIEEVGQLYARVARLLAPGGVFVVHTFPNLWYYRYDYARKRRLARQLGAYLPLEPRSRYEQLMHINEQSPRVMLRQLQSHFRYVLLWFGDPNDALGNLGSPPRKEFVRAAPSLFALASHKPLHIENVQRLFRMPALDPRSANGLRIRFCGEPPLRISAHSAFRAQIELENHSGSRLHSSPPYPVHLSYHWIDEQGTMRVVDGERTPLAPALEPGDCRRYSVRISPPGTAGRWTLRLTLVQETIRWFDAAPTSLWADVATISS
jgi:SAM-dependent methyltransferase